MRPCEEDGHIKLLKYLQRSRRRVIRCIVQHHHSVTAPLRPLLIQFLDQTIHENLDHLTVGVLLVQREIDVTSRVQSNDHGHTRDDLKLGHRVGRIGGLPFAESVVTHTKPSFVDIQNDLAALPYFEELERELLP